MRRVKLVLKALAAVVAFAVYVWFAAVRALPDVKRRKVRRASQVR